MRLLFALVLLLVFPASAGAVVPFTGTYQGHDDTAWFAADTCRLSLPVVGAEPEGPGPYPVLVYAHGTGAEGTWGSDGQLTPVAQAVADTVVREAAAAGFVAVYPLYRGRWTVGSNAGTDAQTTCMFNRSRASRSALDAVCARPRADCSRIVAAGHSQGGMIALRAANHASAVRAAWSLGVMNATGDPLYWTARERGGRRALPDVGVRIATGYEDLHNWLTWLTGASYGALRTFTGTGCADGSRKCLRADGSGWEVVPHLPPPDGPTDGHAGHCFMNVDGRSFCGDVQAVDPFWLDGASSWTLRSGLEWLRVRAG